ncbi:MAG: hypothetical protein RLP16_05425 [Alphaproteobacteria bacterium]
MALKELISERGAIAEEMIEKIISPYVRYEIDPHEIVFTQDGFALDNVARILVYLVAVQGWKYVVDDDPDIETKPADLEEVLGIPGNTLRPALKKLKDANLITSNNASYAVKPSNLDAVKRAVEGEKSVAARKKAAKSKPRMAKKQKDDQSTDQPSKPRRKSGTTIRGSIATLLDEGFFDEFQSLGQVSNRLREKAIIAKVTSLSGPIAEFVRDRKLTRRKIKRGTKEVWYYKKV